jgi:hypothetical protein
MALGIANVPAVTVLAPARAVERRGIWLGLGVLIVGPGLAQPVTTGNLGQLATRVRVISAWGLASS